MTKAERLDGDFHLGPKLMALESERCRQFCIAYAQNGGNAVQACHTAGYTAVKMTGWRLLQRDDVKAALDELMQAELKSLTPAAILSMRNLLADPNHKDHAKTVFAVLDRTGFHAKSEHKMSVEHQVKDSELIGAIKSLAQELGIDHRKLLGTSAPALAPPRVIDAEVVEVTDGSEGLEDLLA